MKMEVLEQGAYVCYPKLHDFEVYDGVLFLFDEVDGRPKLETVIRSWDKFIVGKDDDEASV